MSSIENTGSITFWRQEGSVYLDGRVNNTKDMCFREQVVKLYEPAGAGCFAFLNSTVLISDPHESFSPTFVLEGSNNYIYLEYNFIDLTIHIVNFENVKYITIDEKYETFSDSNGSLILDFFGTNLTLDIGSGYDKKRITVERDKRNTHISYNGSSPSNGTKNAYCACSFVPPVEEATSPTPVSEAESSSSNNDDKGKGNQNSKNSSLTISMPIYFCLLSLAISYMIM